MLAMLASLFLNLVHVSLKSNEYFDKIEPTASPLDQPQEDFRNEIPLHSQLLKPFNVLTVMQILKAKGGCHHNLRRKSGFFHHRG